ncbi:CBL-interacting serine/threonine-protein kinase 21 [Acorus gramineus]|uniref:non-specific serine/threonine protein kinase n=1 Tax=Acorus gramineus TaxID=55184 RepID=A0AAV9BI02_ACOGR|nr:CBL-interacting serine/threonine-protein kinase 21 [Acorus gramineus]
MGYTGSVGKYQIGRTIGEGSFAKVKVAVNVETLQNVAVKIIDKHKVLEQKLVHQVKREISTMKLLNHPNIVRIYEVIATRSKIYIIMEYISGGQLSDKLFYLKRLSENEARKCFQQLIDAIDYCHSRGVYHRDLKPENLLLDSKGNLKVTDFGLSVLRKPGDLLSTSCGSPSYVAPEVINNQNYEGAAADVWSCGVILFELLAGYLPFQDRNLLQLYRKISRGQFICPRWFTASQKKLILKILNPLSYKRMTIAEILEDDWFRVDFVHSPGTEQEESTSLDDVNLVFESDHAGTDEKNVPKSPSFINAFQLIAMSDDLNLSGLFEEQDMNSQKRKLGSKHSIIETIEKIEMAARDVNLSVERTNVSKVKLHGKKLLRSRSHVFVSAEVIEVTPTHCVVEISKSAGELRVYKEFCESLSNVLKEKPLSSSRFQGPVSLSRDEQQISIAMTSDITEPRGYSSS